MEGFVIRMTQDWEHMSSGWVRSRPYLIRMTCQCRVSLHGISSGCVFGKFIVPSGRLNWGWYLVRMSNGPLSWFMSSGWDRRFWIFTTRGGPSVLPHRTVPEPLFFLTGLFFAIILSFGHQTRNKKFESKWNNVKMMHLKMSSARCRQFCLAPLYCR